MFEAKIGLVVIGLCCSAVSACADDSEPPRYSLRDYGGGADPFGPANLTTEFIPLNRTYSELTAEDKSKFRRLYVSMEEGDEPPFPERGLDALYAPLLQAQAKRGVTGRFKAELVVDATGKVQEVRVYRSPDKVITQFISQLALLTAFKPAVCAGQPCRMSFPIDVRFQLR